MKTKKTRKTYGVVKDTTFKKGIRPNKNYSQRIIDS